MYAQVCLRREPPTSVTITLHSHGIFMEIVVPLCVELMHTETAQNNRLLQRNELIDVTAGRLPYSATLIRNHI